MSMELMMKSLRYQVEMTEYCGPLKDCSPKEINDFNQAYPGFHMVIGDFAIRCINPQKYGIEPREDFNLKDKSV